MLGNRKRNFDRRNLNPELIKLDLWPTVDVTLLPKRDQGRYLRLEKAVRAYLVDFETVEAIREDYSIGRHALVRLVKRCLATHPDRRLWGFRALISHCRQKRYERQMRPAGKAETKNTGHAGQLGLLFETYPHLKELVDMLFLKKPVSGHIHEPRIPLNQIHARFIKDCRKAGIKTTQYPFIVKEMGRVALWNYLQKTFHAELAQAVKARLGKEAARKAKLIPTDVLEQIPVTRPLERVEFDAHRIDAFFVLLIESPLGGIIEKVLDRIWLLAIIDVLTHVVLGYHLCFSREYSAEDVLQCVKNTIVPWQPKELTIPGLKYPEGSGFPSATFTELEYALWDEFAYDNAKANLSDRVVTGLISTVGCTVAPGKIDDPNARNLIERFFGILEESGFHRLPSTTGSNPKDSRRQDPEKAALKYKIALQDMEELTDVMIAQYNGRPNSGLGSRTPLESLSYYLNSEGWAPRQLPGNQRQNIQILNLHVTRQIKGNVLKGTRPYVNFEGIRYKSDVLIRSSQLIGQKLSLSINPEDPRSIRAHLLNGAEFGVLTATGIWGRRPHTLEQRRAVLLLRRKKLIYYTENDDPIEIYLDYLAKKALTHRGARRKVARKQYEERRQSGTEPQLPKKESTANTDVQKTSRKPSAPKPKFTVPTRKTFNY